jgi:hypothetical protein
MADPAVQKLRDAFADAPAGPVTLNSAFWSSAGLTPPVDFTAKIKAAYRLPESANGLQITYDRGAVTPVSDDRFQVTGVSLTFLTAPADNTTATIFGSPGTPATPTLGIDVVPAGWQLSELFPAMTGWPFDLLKFDQQRFFYTTSDRQFTWSGTTLRFAAGQNLYGALPVPPAIQVLIQLVQNLPNPASVVMGGPIVLDKADNETVLFPDMDIAAPITGGSSLTLFFIPVVNPRIGFVISTPPVVTAAADEADAEDADSIIQNPYYFLGVDINLSAAPPVAMAVRALVSKDATNYQFVISAVDSTNPITPASIVTLMARGSYFDSVPPVLQEYLASVQMQGFSIGGPLKPVPGIGSLTATLGSVQGQPIKLFFDPTSGQIFELQAFSLTWTMMDPLVPASRRNLINLQAFFTLFPTVFKTKDGKPGGLFKIVIDQDMNITGGFDGTASLDDILRSITGGAIGLPEGVSVSFSDISVSASPSRKAYSLGFVVDADVTVPFIQYTDPATGNPAPLIQIDGLGFSLSANTPSSTPDQKGTTVYAGSMAGTIIIGPVAANVDVTYDGSLATPLWTLNVTLAQPVVLSELIDQFFRAYNLPSFLPGTLTVEALAIDATIPVEKKAAPAATSRRMQTRSLHGGAHTSGRWRSPVRPLAHPARHIGLPAPLVAEPPQSKSAYSVSTKIRWVFNLTADIPIDILAELGLNYDGNRKVGEEFAGSAIGTIDIDLIGPVQIGYRFGAKTDAKGAPALTPLPRPAVAAAALPTNSTLWMSWKGFRADYNFDNETVSFSLTGWTVGSLITALVEMIGDPYFTLPEPWSVLNSISLNGFSLEINLTKGVTNRVTAKYTLPSPITLGFITIKGVQFLQANGKTTLAIDGSTTVPGLNSQPLFNPAAGGQDVKDMPTVPGRGNAYFDLKLLALGQRISIAGAPTFKSTQQVIKALETIPPSGGSTIPFDPSKQDAGQPYYNVAADWLAAMHFGILQIPNTANYCIDFMVVFSDPDLYGLRLALNGDKMKVLAGLAIDVLYKKVTDDIGCYQIEFTLPNALRNLDFGAFSVTLPTIGLQIYTNGDFLVDFGFPYNMDFSRSFTVQAIIFGIPVLGSGGFYFGKLSNATAPNLPATTKGTFHPVIVFGLGAQLGVGRYIDKGILKAGFSITVFGIIEGTLASWHPYQIGNNGQANEVQGDYYFKITGTFGIIGKLYGSIDFAIIKADVSLTVTVYVQISYESFRKIPLTLSASVQISVSVKIDLGLFSISISLSFSAHITEQLTIGSDSQAPWDPDQASLTMSFAPSKALIEARRVPLPRTLHELGIHGRPLRLDFALPHAKFALAAAAKQALEITALTQFTVLAPEDASYAQQEGGLVLLFAMDAPLATGSDPGGQTSFGKLCGGLLPWIIASVVPEPDTPLPPLGPGQVSRPLLEGILRALSDPKQAPFTPQQLVDFLAANFTVSVSAASATLAAARKAALDQGSTIFPALAFLSMTVPNPDAASGTIGVDYSAYVTASQTYQEKLRIIFNSMAANVASETTTPAAQAGAVAPGDEPMAASVFTDYFILLARQLVQGGIDAFDDYPYPLTATTSLQSILDWANGLLAGQLTASNLLAANLIYPLNGDRKLQIADVDYMVQTGDTLATIAARYSDPAVPQSTSPASLIITNQAQTNLIVPGVTVTIDDHGPKSYTTKVGDGFAKIADALGITIDALSLQTSLYTQVGLLAPSIVTTIPNVIVTTKTGDTISEILSALHVPKESFLTAANLALQGLFQVDPSLRFAVPGLIVLNGDRLWPAILSTGTLGQTAGTAARYMLHGMRLPVAQGLNIPGTGFLYGPPHWTTSQKAYGVYQLTGQQFPLATRSGAYDVTLNRPTTPQYDWITLGGGTSLTWDISAQTAILSQVVTTARQHGYQPTVTDLAAEPETTLSPRVYGMATYVPWLTSDIDRLTALTAAPSPRQVASATSTPQAKPLLFGLSTALLSAVEATQASLSTEIPKVTEQMRYLPVLAPRLGTSDPATSKTDFTDIDGYCFAARIDFRIKYLAQDADLAPDRPDANNVVPPGPGNSGSPARPLAPFAYEIIGPDPAQAVLLERLLTAMDSAGEALVSDLFLLYGDINNGANGLTSRAASEFLSYIVQSNLSTETNPPQALRQAMLAAQPGLPTGIVNKPAEFIKLLWELSTVNSGGTYLFYQLLADGTGLPPALFDQNGVATLTLVATIRRDARPKGARIFNAINALVTTAAIDPQSSIVQLVGVSAPTQSMDLDAGYTIGGIADFYGIDIAGLAAENLKAVLAKNKPIRISGLYHQLLPADVGTGKDPIAALAAYYSIGATAPINPSDILNFNPGVTVAAFSVFRIPPFTYAVTDRGPGNSLESMAAYYACDPAALAYAARAEEDLFTVTTLTINPLLYEANANLGLGNAGLTLQRERGLAPGKLPAQPTEPELEAYTSATLLQLYQLLSARIVSTPFFEGSVDSAAFGPKDPPAPDGDAPSARKLGAPLKAADPNQPYLYSQTVGFARDDRALVNPVDPKVALPPASANPYMGIGTLVQIAIDWLDLFGNRTPNPFQNPQAADPPPFGNVPMALTYSDMLIPIDSWPSTTRGYYYDGTAGSPALKITLKFDPTPYNPAAVAAHRHLNSSRLADELPVWQRNATTDLAKFERIYFQLNQDYDKLAKPVPGLSGPAVTMTMFNSLLATPERQLSDTERKAILAYVDAAFLYLSARSEGKAATPPADTVLTIPVDLNALTLSSDIIRLQLALNFSRQSDLVAPTLRALRNGVTVSCNIPVDASLPAPSKASQIAGEPPYPVALTLFATRFETAFVAADWQMRIGTSSADPSAPSNTRTPTVWAVRMAKRASARGIGFQIGNAPRYFAPLPIASSLQTLQVDIDQYVTGQPYPAGTPVPTTFTNVDPNVWLSECLTAIDDLLSAGYSTPLFQLDRLLGLDDDPASPTAPDAGYLYRMLDHKRALAAAIASTATSVLAQSVADNLKAAAVDKLEQALLRQLSNANTLTCVAVFPVTDAHYAPAQPPDVVAAPRLFGQPGGVLNGGKPAGNDNFALSTAKIPLNATGSDSTLAFLASSRSAETEAYVELKLSYALTHVEHDIRNVPGIKLYEQSRWITFLTGPYQTPITPPLGDYFSIPVALRALPVPATVVAQSGTPTYPDSANATSAQLKIWNYSFSYLLNQAAQDSVIAEVVFNLDAGTLANAFVASPSDTLFNKLAQFVAIYPAVARDLETYLRPINGKTEASSPDVANANAAMSALETVVKGVTNAYVAWAEEKTPFGLTPAPMPRVAYTFEILLVPSVAQIDEQTAVVKIVPQSFTETGTKKDNFLPLAKVLIDPDNYQAILIPGSSDPTTGAASWRYELRADAKDPNLPKHLPYETARQNAQREIVFVGLDLFALQNGWASVQVARNYNLSPDPAVKTTDAFRFTTAQSRFADTLVPILDVAAYPLDKTTTGPAPVADWLNPFFTSLLTPAAGITFAEPVLLKIETSYRYAQVSNAAIIPQTTLPVSLLAPTPTEGATSPPFITTVGNLAQDWFDNEDPVTAPPADFSFGVTVFSGTGTNRLPLMTIGALTLSASNVKPD